MKIEKITAITAAQAAQIYVSGWQEGFRGIVPQQFLDGLSTETWVSRLGASSNKDYILEDNDVYVAVSSISAARDESMRGWGEIISLYVLPEYFRKGYGRVLFSFAAEQLHTDGFRNIYLWVLEENIRARAFYEAMGFSSNGDRTMRRIDGADLAELRYVNSSSG